MKKKYLAMLMTATIAMSTVLATVGCGARESQRIRLHMYRLLI